MGGRNDDQGLITSLDAGEEHLFRHVNRPHKDITFHKMVNGLYELRKCFSGQYWLEVLLLGGITGLPVPVREIAQIASWIGPDRIHLNTVIRPPAQSFAVPVPRVLMEGFAAAFGNNAEVVIGWGKNLPKGGSSTTPQEVMALVSRRPSTMEDISAGLGPERSEASRNVDLLSAAGLLEYPISAPLL